MCTGNSTELIATTLFTKRVRLYTLFSCFSRFMRLNTCKFQLNLNVNQGGKMHNQYLTALLLASSFACNAAILEVHDENNFLYTNSKEPKLHSQIINNSDSEQSVLFRKKRIEMPEGWDVTFCVKQCLPPFMDETTVIIGAGDTVSLDVDYLINSDITDQGTAITEFSFFPESDSSEKYVRSYGITYGEEISDPSLTFHVNSPSKLASVDEMVEHKITVENSNDSDAEVTITRNEIQVPEDWHITMCFDVCMAPFVKSADWNIPANGSREIQVDVESKSNGTAILQFDIGLKGKEVESSLLLSYPTQAAPTALVPPKSNKTITPVSLFKTGSVYSLNMNNSGYTQVSLFNMRGQLLSKLHRGNVMSGETVKMDVSSFGTGNLMLKIEQAGQTHAFPIRNY